jgi:segregation and condensation protein A
MADAAEPDPLWDDWEAPPRVLGVPELHLAGFDGPMDLLLELAERQRFDLGQISILQLTEQFLAGMERLERRVALERRADWLVMAARLLLLRSRLLFPASPEVEAEAAQDAGLEARRLDQLMFTRAAASWLDRQPQLGRDVFARRFGRSPRVASYMMLMEACLAVLRGRDAEPVAEEPAYRPQPATLFRVDAAMARIRALVAGRQEEIDFVRCLPEVSPDDPLSAAKARSAVASSLVAALELARGGEVSITQKDWQAPIMVAASG